MDKANDVLGIKISIRPMTMDVLRSAGGQLVGWIIEYRIPENELHNGVSFRTERGEHFVHPEITTRENLKLRGKLLIQLRSDALLLLSDDCAVVHRECSLYEPLYTTVDSVIALATQIANPGVCARETACHGTVFAQLKLRNAVLLSNERGDLHEPVLWCSACYDACRAQVGGRLLIDGRDLGLRAPVALTGAPSH